MSDLPGWNPLGSAIAGAGFATFLAAVVLSITVQIATKNRTDPHATVARGPLNRSLEVAPLAVVILLIAGYLYIVLAGVNSQVASLGKDVSLSTVGEGYKYLAAETFSMAGTVFATGAVITLYIIYSVLYETTGRRSSPARWGRAAFFIALFVVMYFLICGYYVGYITANQCPPSEMWFAVQILCIGLLPFVLCIPTIRAKIAKALSARLRNKGKGSQRFMALAFAAGLPAVAAITRVSVGPNWSHRDQSTWFAASSGLYYAIVSSALTISLPPAPSGRSRPLPEPRPTRTGLASPRTTHRSKRHAADG